jgi:hypothetical protein
MRVPVFIFCYSAIFKFMEFSRNRFTYKKDTIKNVGVRMEGEKDTKMIKVKKKGSCRLKM